MKLSPEFIADVRSRISDLKKGKSRSYVDDAAILAATTETLLEMFEAQKVEPKITINGHQFTMREVVTALFQTAGLDHKDQGSVQYKFPTGDGTSMAMKLSFDKTS